MSMANKVKEIIQDLRDMSANIAGLEAEVEHWKKLSGQDTAVQQQIKALKSDNLALQNKNELLQGRIKVLKATLRSNGIAEPADL